MFVVYILLRVCDQCGWRCTSGCWTFVRPSGSSGVHYDTRPWNIANSWWWPHIAKHVPICTSSGDAAIPSRNNECPIVLSDNLF